MAGKLLGDETHTVFHEVTNQDLEKHKGHCREKLMLQHSGPDEWWKGKNQPQLFHGNLIQQPVYEPAGEKKGLRLTWAAISAIVSFQQGGESSLFRHGMAELV